MTDRLRVGVVGCGTAGAATALLLARDGHDVQVLDRATELRPTGADILLQHLGQHVMHRLGLGESLRQLSSPVRSVDARTCTGRTVMDFAYADGGGGEGWGVHRGDLFAVLHGALLRDGVPVHTGVRITGARRTPDGRTRLLTADGQNVDGFDLVVAADGARSAVRTAAGLARTDRPYAYGAVWAIVDDPGGIAGDCLFQRYRDTRVTFGVLPTGGDRASIFWSERADTLAATLAGGTRRWQERVLPVADRMAPLVERVAPGQLLAAPYRDVVSRTTAPGLVLVGDAAHAMSPQLGTGASMALADAWSLATSIHRHPGDLPRALAAHRVDRRAHVRWYTWLSRGMTPLFQSSLVPLGWGRDAVVGPLSRHRIVRSQMVTLLRGTRTGPWSHRRLPERDATGISRGGRPGSRPAPPGTPRS